MSLIYLLETIFIGPLKLVFEIIYSLAFLAQLVQPSLVDPHDVEDVGVELGADVTLP